LRPEALAYLRCPMCGDVFLEEDLRRGERRLRCPQGHSFDLARQGYVDLLPGGAHRPRADTASMVRAREAFLGAGHFAGLRRAVAAAAARALRAAGAAAAPPHTPRPPEPEPGCIVEVGAGTAYHLAGVLEVLPAHWGIALDLSKYAARRAAKAHPRVAAAVVCDVWRGLPLRSSSVDLILDVFAPRNAPEFSRVLRPQGRLLVVAPTARHLHELVRPLGLLSVDERKEERLQRTLSAHFVPVRTDYYLEQWVLTPEETVTLINMGPSAHHLRPHELAQRLDDLLHRGGSSGGRGSGRAGDSRAHRDDGEERDDGGQRDEGDDGDDLPESRDPEVEAPGLTVTVSVRLTEYQVLPERARA
jgi:23S rRNA (guanine745-N1)-methyltransferase